MVLVSFTETELSLFREMAKEYKSRKASRTSPYVTELDSLPRIEILYRWGVLDEDLDAGSTATVSLWEGNSNEWWLMEKDSGLNVTGSAEPLQTDTIDAGTNVKLVRWGPLWYVEVPTLDPVIARGTLQATMTAGDSANCVLQGYYGGSPVSVTDWMLVTGTEISNGTKIIAFYDKTNTTWYAVNALEAVTPLTDLRYYATSHEVEVITQKHGAMGLATASGWTGKITAALGVALDDIQYDSYTHQIQTSLVNFYAFEVTNVAGWTGSFVQFYGGEALDDLRYEPYGNTIDTSPVTIYGPEVTADASWDVQINCVETTHLTSASYDDTNHRYEFGTATSVVLETAAGADATITMTACSVLSNFQYDATAHAYQTTQDTIYAPEKDAGVAWDGPGKTLTESTAIDDIAYSSTSHKLETSEISWYSPEVSDAAGTNGPSITMVQCTPVVDQQLSGLNFQDKHATIYVFESTVGSFGTWTTGTDCP